MRYKHLKRGDILKTGQADLPLHYGKAPPWLFERMIRLSRGIIEFLIEERGPLFLLSRLSDPYWFQSLGCVLGFDWHSSGVTTTTCGAIKEALKGRELEFGIFPAGGKGAASRKTPSEIEAWAEKSDLKCSPKSLTQASRVSAKVDNNALQDGYQIYHHFFIFDREGNWAVVQQGMNEENGYARRYHWFSKKVTDFVEEPHTAICCDLRGDALNLVSAESRKNREVCAQLSRERPDKISGEIRRMKELSLPRAHQLKVSDLKPASIERVLLLTYERQPEDFYHLLAMPRVGAKTLRALSLIAELVYGTPASWDDPARYSFAHGGKDGYPYPVDRETYDQSIEILEKALLRMKLSSSERENALRRLANLF